MAYLYIKRAYGLDYEPGERVRHSVTNKDGTVKREDVTCSHYVKVQFDGQKHSLPCHPEELDKIGG